VGLNWQLPTGIEEEYLKGEGPVLSRAQSHLKNNRKGKGIKKVPTELAGPKVAATSETHHYFGEL